MYDVNMESLFSQAYKLQQQNNSFVIESFFSGVKCRVSHMELAVPAAHAAEHRITTLLRFFEDTKALNSRAFWYYQKTYQVLRVLFTETLKFSIHCILIMVFMIFILQCFLN